MPDNVPFNRFFFPHLLNIVFFILDLEDRLIDCNVGRLGFALRSLIYRRLLKKGYRKLSNGKYRYDYRLTWLFFNFVINGFFIVTIIWLVSTRSIVKIGWTNGLRLLQTFSTFKQNTSAKSTRWLTIVTTCHLNAIPLIISVRTVKRIIF